MSAPHRYSVLTRAAQATLLRSIVGRVRTDASARGPAPVVVFDLDGTLMDNRPRTAAILREFAQTIGDEDAEVAQRFRACAPDALAYLLTDSLAGMGITKSDLVARVETFWRDRFFGDEHLKHDVAIDGAVEFTKACYEAGAIVVYMTGRDLPLMGIGSFRSLRDLGFPIGLPGTELVLKPDANMPDEAFKRLEAPKLARVGTIVAVFDNEPANCNTLLEMNPGCHSVLLDTQHLPGAPPLDARVQVIANFAMK
jgi:hypothetical protein